MKTTYTQIYGQEFITACMREREVAQGSEGRGESLCVLAEDGKQIRRRKGLVKDSTAWDRTVYVVSTSPFVTSRHVRGVESKPGRAELMNDPCTHVTSRRPG